MPNRAKAKQACLSMVGREVKDVPNRVVVTATALLIVQTGSVQRDNLMMLIMISTDSDKVI